MNLSLDLNQVDKLKEFLLNKYPSRANAGIREIRQLNGMTEVMFNGGETLYLSNDFVNKL